MVRDDHVGCSRAGVFKEHDQREVFEDGSERDGRDSFRFRGSCQSGELESNHGIISDKDNRVTSRWWKYLPH
jgi:hypothetical protein